MVWRDADKFKEKMTCLAGSKKKAWMREANRVSEIKNKNERSRDE